MTAMKKFDNDILASKKGLKGMPYSVPEGYFDGLRQSMKGIPAASAARRTFPVRVVPYIAMAAMFAMLVAAGGFFLERSESEFTQEDYIVFSDEMTSTIFYDGNEQYAEAVSEDDIIEYLIYTGVEIEDIETY